MGAGRDADGTVCRPGPRRVVLRHGEASRRRRRPLFGVVESHIFDVGVFAAPAASEPINCVILPLAPPPPVSNPAPSLLLLAHKENFFFFIIRLNQTKYRETLQLALYSTHEVNEEKISKQTQKKNIGK